MILTDAGPLIALVDRSDAGHQCCLDRRDALAGIRHQARDSECASKIAIPSAGVPGLKSKREAQSGV